MVGHTPGPWWLITDENGRFSVKAGPFSLADLWHPPAGTAEANARLIAAAPDLLEALKKVVFIADRRTSEFDAAHAAIAKAEGRGAPGEGS